MTHSTKANEGSQKKKRKTGKSQRTRGFRWEREAVKYAQAEGLDARRFWGSDGRSAGLSKDADIEITWSERLGGSLLFQCKTKKSELPKWLQTSNMVTGVLVRVDGNRGKSVERWALIPYEVLLALLREARDYDDLIYHDTLEEEGNA